MGKYVLTADDGSEVVLHDDTLRRFIEEAIAAHDGDEAAKEVLPLSARYVAEMLRQVTCQPSTHT